eukprot:Seg1872.1 transcript_id=Seg1872.1/GoldUCD/mRNA.D3Y31 product="putative protein K02A2.6" protein_id=Seg1872.1/GoldUCD/D3Y31
MKEIIHQGHNGMERCKSCARQSLYWPGMNADIEELVARCSYCLTYRNKQQSEHLIDHEIPNSPWIKVASDVFHLLGHQYVIVTDYYSGYIEIEWIADTTSPSVITKLKKIFARHGIPQELFSDNGPEYIANEFASFSKEWDFKHTTSSPYFAQSNGLVERSIQTVKRTLKKGRDAGEDPYLALLVLNTISGSDGISPAIRLFNRNPRTLLPSLIQHPPSVSANRTKRPDNRNTKDLPSIRPVKRTLKKARDAGEDPYLALLVLNTIPGSDGISPAIRLFNRNPRTLLPSLIQHPPSVSANRAKRPDNRNTKDLPSIRPGSVVRMRVPGDKDWRNKGKVIEKSKEPRSYRVLNEKGNIVRRNRRHLIPCHDRFSIQHDYDPIQLTDLPLAIHPHASNPDPHAPNSDPQPEPLEQHPEITPPLPASPAQPFLPPETSNQPTSSTLLVPHPNEQTEPVQVTRRGRVIRKPLRYR